MLYKSCVSIILLFTQIYLMMVVQSLQEQQVISNYEWMDGCASFYGHEYWLRSIHEGSCGFGYLCPEEGTGWNVAAISTNHPQYSSSCGRCYEVKCRSTNKFQDQKINDNNTLANENNFDCFDFESSLVITVTDSYPGSTTKNLNFNDEQCCEDGDTHFHLSVWAFQKLANITSGSIGLSYREVPCNYIPQKQAKPVKNPHPPTPVRPSSKCPKNNFSVRHEILNSNFSQDLNQFSQLENFKNDSQEENLQEMEEIFQNLKEKYDQYAAQISYEYIDMFEILFGMEENQTINYSKYTEYPYQIDSQENNTGSQQIEIYENLNLLNDTYIQLQNQQNQWQQNQFIQQQYPKLFDTNISNNHGVLNQKIDDENHFLQNSNYLLNGINQEEFFQHGSRNNFSNQNDQVQDFKNITEFEFYDPNVEGLNFSINASYLIQSLNQLEISSKAYYNYDNISHNNHIINTTNINNSSQINNKQNQQNNTNNNILEEQIYQRPLNNQENILLNNNNNINIVNKTHNYQQNQNNLQQNNSQNISNFYQTNNNIQQTNNQYARFNTNTLYQFNALDANNIQEYHISSINNYNNDDINNIQQNFSFNNNNNNNLLVDNQIRENSFFEEETIPEYATLQSQQYQYHNQQIYHINNSNHNNINNYNNYNKSNNQHINQQQYLQNFVINSSISNGQFIQPIIISNNNNNTEKIIYENYQGQNLDINNDNSALYYYYDNNNNNNDNNNNSKVYFEDVQRQFDDAVQRYEQQQQQNVLRNDSLDMEALEDTFMHVWENLKFLKNGSFNQEDNVSVMKSKKGIQREVSDSQDGEYYRIQDTFINKVKEILPQLAPNSSYYPH